MKLEEYLDDLRFFKKSKNFLQHKKKKVLLNKSQSSSLFERSRRASSFKKAVPIYRSSPIGTKKIMKEVNNDREYMMISNMKTSKLSQFYNAN